MNKYAKITGITLVAVLALGLAAFGGAAIASAQTATPTPTTPNGGLWPGHLDGLGPRGPVDANGQPLFDEATRQSIMAEALGLTVDELKADLAAGKTPPQIAQEKGLDEATFKANLQTARNKVLDQFVAAGKLTQAQADAIKQHAADCGLGGGHKGGHHGPFGGGRPGGLGNPAGTTSPTATPAP